MLEEVEGIDRADLIVIPGHPIACRPVGQVERNGSGDDLVPSTEIDEFLVGWNDMGGPFREAIHTDLKNVEQADWWAVLLHRPPFTGMMAPFRYGVSRSRTQQMTSAISRGSAGRPSGIWPREYSNRESSVQPRIFLVRSNTYSVMGVPATRPGATTLIANSSPARSRAMHWTIACNAAFEELYAVLVRIGRHAASLPTTTTRFKRPDEMLQACRTLSKPTVFT